MGNNSVEVDNIKIFVSILYFVHRIENEKRISSRKTGERSLEKNWNIRGFFTADGSIRSIHWRIKLGQNKMNNDDFDSTLSRVYSMDLCDAYEKRKVINPTAISIKVTDSLIKIIKELNDYTNSDSVSGKKFLSAFRFNYEMLEIYSNMDQSIILIATILETLLLEKDESNQRKKVSVRSACILNDGLELKYKRYISSYIYYFYKYRNAIVHDGKSYLDFDEVSLNNMVENMKHIIFEIIYFYYKSNFSSIQNIKDIVINNYKADGLENAFDYIKENAMNAYEYCFPE